MATVTYANKQMGIPQFMAGSFTSDNSAQTLTLGFIPGFIQLVNETDGIIWQKIGNQATANCQKFNSTGPAISVDTNSYITIGTDGTVTLHATLVGNSKAFKWFAIA